MSLNIAGIGEHGGKWILPNATTTPDTGNSWCGLYVVSSMEVTAVVGPNVDGTHGTKTWAAGAFIPGIFTSITCSNTQSGGLIFGVYRRRS